MVSYCRGPKPQLCECLAICPQCRWVAGQWSEKNWEGLVVSRCGQDELQRKIKGISSPWIKVWCAMEMCESRASWKTWRKTLRCSETSSVLSAGIL